MAEKNGKKSARFRLPQGGEELTALLAKAPALIRYPILALENFLADQAHLRAAALTYTTLLSIVPVMAFGFALVRGFGLDIKFLDYVLIRFFPATTSNVYEMITGFIERVNAKTIGAVGLGGFVITVVITLNTVERALNIIFEVKRPRTIIRKFTDYFSIVLLSPLLLGITLSAITLIQLKSWLGALSTHWLFTGAAAIVLELVPLFGAVVLFSFVFIVLPNKQIRPLPAAVGGIVGG